MKSLLSFLLLLSIAFLLHSCYSSVPISVKKAPNNQTYNIAYLFEKDGYKMYRFRDEDRYVYFTTKNGSTTTVKDDSVKTTIQVINPE